MSFSTTAYVTVDEAEDYFLGVLKSDAWDDASDTEKQKSLIEATRRIDRLNFSGIRTADFNARLHGVNLDGTLPGTLKIPPSSQLPSQELEFPRDGSTTIPTEVQAACCEIALSLLDGVDPEIEMRKTAQTQVQFSSVQETYDPRWVNLAFKSGIPSMTAWNYLKPFLADPFDIQLRRV